jgi:hypothetical protein
MWADGQTCESYFHQMLFWEAEDPVLGKVHHLAVLCYYLQHPHLYSPEGLRWAVQLLVAFVEQGAAPAEMRQRERDKLASDKRAWKIAATSAAQGGYANPVAWTMTAADVVAGGATGYIANVEAWAASMLTALRASGNVEIA